MLVCHPRAPAAPDPMLFPQQITQDLIPEIKHREAAIIPEQNDPIKWIYVLCVILVFTFIIFFMVASRNDYNPQTIQNQEILNSSTQAIIMRSTQ